MEKSLLPQGKWLFYMEKVYYAPMISLCLEAAGIP